MKKKSVWVGIIAAFAALAGVAVAVGLFIKNAGKKLDVYKRQIPERVVVSTRSVSLPECVD